MRRKVLNEDYDQKIYELAYDVSDFSMKYIKGGYTILELLSRKPMEALSFARALKNNKKLFNAVKANWKAIYDILEDQNNHTATLGLAALFNPKEFKQIVYGYVDQVLGYVK